MAAISGLVKMSLVDWPGKVAAVIFLSGCNFRCPWCQNPDLVKPVARKASTYPWSQINEYLLQRRQFLDGVVITGGEPTIASGLETLLQNIKQLGLAVKVDTNGSNPTLVEYLFREKLVTAVAVDYKLPLSLYSQYLGASNSAAVRRTLEEVLSKQIGYARTTVVPGIHTPQILSQMRTELPLLSPQNYRLQAFQPGNCLDPTYDQLPAITSQDLKYLGNAIFSSPGLLE